jgi:phenylpropionate dioxygenase-like ring-hydroxylating dioxygenase large terminal subunit
MAQPVNLPLPLIDPEVARAATLPAHFYTEPQLLAREKDAIFARTWQLVGYREQVAKAGDYFTFDLAGEPLLVVRGSDGQLRGFYNVCRHRAGPPAEGCGSRKVFRCGYHGWTYALDGHLITAPEFEGVKDFDAAQFGLRAVRCEEWSGMVFVNLDQQAAPLISALGELPSQAEKFGLAEMRFHLRRDYVMQCNWKTYIDNYLEGYHLPSVHPSLNRELDYGDYTTVLFPRHSLQKSAIRAAQDSADPAGRRYANASSDDAAEYFWVFPNWMLNCYPDNVSVNMVLPLGPEQTVAIFLWFFPAATLKTDVPETTVRFSDEIQLEDGNICEVVQRNLRSRSYERGRYSVQQERGLHHFHRLYADTMGL